MQNKFRQETCFKYLNYIFEGVHLTNHELEEP